MAPRAPFNPPPHGSPNSWEDRPPPRETSLERVPFSLVSLNGELEEGTLREVPVPRGCRVKAEKERLGWGEEGAAFSASHSSRCQGALACGAVQRRGAQTPLTF